MILCSKTLKKLGFCLSCLAVAFLFVLAGTGEAAAKRKPARARARPAQAYVAPYSDLVLDATTGRILHETDSASLRHPASLTKMMTLYLTFQAIEAGRVRLDTRLPVSANAARQAPSKLGLRPGQQIKVYDAILSVVTKSANDVAVVLAEGIGGSVPQFVAAMNAQARILGMRQTVFHNPSGLPDPDQVTTARDMATLAMALISHYPGFYPYFSRESFAYNGQVMANHNHLMSRYEGMDGIKTGYVNASGFNLVASAVHGQTRLVGVIFGGKSAAQRDRQMQSLLDDAFQGSASAPRKAPPAPREAALTMPTKDAPDEETTPVKKARHRTVREREIPIQEAAAGTAEAHAWGVQIGAFGDVLSARQLLLGLMNTMKPVLGAAQPSLQKLTMTDGSTVYRARFIGLDQASARAVCTHLIQKGQGCLVVSGS